MNVAIHSAIIVVEFELDNRFGRTHELTLVVLGENRKEYNRLG